MNGRLFPNDFTAPNAHTLDRWYSDKITFHLLGNLMRERLLQGLTLKSEYTSLAPHVSR